MTQHDNVSDQDELYIYSPATGYLKAWAQETREKFHYMATLRVMINSKNFPGIDQMRINTNTFDVWQADNPEVLKKIAESFIHPEWTR